MNEIGKITGRPHKLFDYYGAEDAERVIILMGSGAETATEAVDFLLSKGEKIGMINVHLYRPFSPKHFFQALPKSVKKIAVLDRTKEPGAMGEPLYQDICSIFKEIGSGIPIVGGRYGLSSKDTTPGQIVSVFENLKQDKPKNNFTIGIVDDVTHTSLPRVEEPKLSTEGLTSAVFWGMGSDGTVGANKNSIKIIGHATDLYCQAYFVYDSKKSGGLTQSHLRFGKNPIRSPYLVTAADFVACHNPSYVHQYDMVAGLKEGGTFLLNCQWSADELDAQLPASMKRALYEKKAKLYIINAIDIARGLGLGNRTNTILQASFFNLTGVIPIEQAVTEMKEAIYKSYFKKKGQKVVDMNNASIDHGINELVASILGCRRGCTEGRTCTGIHQGNRSSDEPPAGRRADGWSDDEVWSGGRHLAGRHFSVREARRRSRGSAVGYDRLHSVQPVCICLSARGNPSDSARRGRSCKQAGRLRYRHRKGRRSRQVPVPYAGFSV